jgi:dienelactone hydrolase
MHMMGKTKESWELLPALLQGAGMAHESAEQQSYAVLAFDFRGHGESEGDPGNADGLLQDAQAAQSMMRTLPEVDPERIVLIGASIGADAAVDTCGEGCIGAISLSPGSYLGPNYNDALVTLGDKSVLCVASEEDSLPAQTCEGGRQALLSDYQIQIYTGRYHGTDMLGITDQQPLLIDLIVGWVSRVMMS